MEALRLKETSLHYACPVPKSRSAFRDHSIGVRLPEGDSTRHTAACSVMYAEEASINLENSAVYIGISQQRPYQTHT